jgi:Haem-binding domain
MPTWLKRLVPILLILFIAMQLVRPAKTNPPVDPKMEIGAVLAVPPQVSSIFQRSCSDCHSNRTVWPWYSNVAPASWLVISDVNDGRHDLNLTNWGSYTQQKQARMLKAMCKEVTEGDMPEFQYTLIHRGAKLSQADVQTICLWTQSVHLPQ